MDKYDNNKFLHHELSGKIIGLLYNIHNELGSGYQEKYYCKAICVALNKEKIPYKEQVYFALKYDGESIGKYFADFIIDNKIILEVKVNPRIYPRDEKQLLGYLKESGLKIGLVASFTKTKVLIRRLIL